MVRTGPPPRMTLACIPAPARVMLLSMVTPPVTVPARTVTVSPSWAAATAAASVPKQVLSPEPIHTAWPPWPGVELGADLWLVHAAVTRTSTASMISGRLIAHLPLWRFVTDSWLVARQLLARDRYLGSPCGRLKYPATGLQSADMPGCGTFARRRLPCPAARWASCQLLVRPSA